MRNSPNGWKQNDIERVYLGYGFDIWSGKNHDNARHPVYRQLRAQWPRHGKVAKVYVYQLIELIDQLEELESGESK